jgi:hypothetical protein
MASKTTGGKNPPKWHQVYPQGSIAGNEEYKFFLSLARHPKYAWRSVASIAKESGLTVKRVEEILQKYYKLGMVFQSDKNEDNWAYWERAPEMLTPATVSVSGKDQDKRITKAKQSLGSGGGATGSGGGNSSSGSRPAAQPVAADDDDDDDIQCKVIPMKSVPSGPAKAAFLKLEDEKCCGKSLSDSEFIQELGKIADFSTDPMYDATKAADSPWYGSPQTRGQVPSVMDVFHPEKWSYTACTRAPGVDVQMGRLREVYSEGELADIQHLQQVASESSSEETRARANAALEARGARRVFSVDLKGEDAEEFIAKLRSRLKRGIETGAVQVAKGFKLPEACEFGELTKAVPAKVSLKDMLAGADSVVNFSRKTA